MAVFYKAKEDIELLRESALMVGKTLSEIAKLIKPGVTTGFLDKRAEEFIRDNGGIPTFKGYGGFPASLCISVNEEVVHGIPGQRELKEGDVVSVDCGVTLNGWVGDSAYTFAISGVSEEVKKLLWVTKQSLYKAAEVCVEGKRLGDIGHAVQTYCEYFGYGVVRELCGHGLGRVMHEDPMIPNYGKQGTGPKLKRGMTIAVEPMITLGKHTVVFERDGWTCRTKDRKPAAHYEHDIAITEEGPDILSSFEEIEKQEKNNINLEQING